MDEPLREGEDYYLENGWMVLTRGFLLRRGFCCKSGCRHCPYTEPSPPGRGPAQDPRAVKKDDAAGRGEDGAA